MLSPAIHHIGRFGYIRRVISRIPIDIAIIGLLIVIASLLLSQAPLSTTRAFTLGGIGSETARHFYRGETSEAGQSFRWTNGDSELRLAPQGLGAHVLRLTLAAPRPTDTAVPVTISINDRPILASDQRIQARQYSLLVPPEWIRLSSNNIRIQSPTFSPDNDTADRSLGVAVFDAEWSAVDRPAWLVPAQIVALAIATSLLYLVLSAGGIGFWARLLTLLLFGAIMLAMRHSDSRFVNRWNALVMTAGLSLLLGAALPFLRRWRTKPVELPLREWANAHWPALAGCLAVSALMLSPLLLRLTTHILGTPGDSYEYLWKMQWFSDALLQQHVSPTFAPQIFYPVGMELTISEITPANTLLAVPLTWLFGAIVSYNLVIAASFVLTAFFTYLLARRLGAAPGPAWVAGLIFAFCLRRFYHAHGHLGMMGTQWLVLTLYGWEGLLTRRRTWDGFVAGLGLALTVWSSWHYGTTFPLVIACYTPIRLGWRALPGVLRGWRALLLMGLITIALVLPLAQPYLEARQRGETYQHLYAQVLLHSATPLAYLLPSPFHPLWGAWALQFYSPEGGEQFVGIAYSAIALALAGIWLGRKQPLVLALATLIVINVVMSFGPELRLSDERSLDLPAKFVYEHVPLIGNIRNWSRMAIYVVMCVALLAGLALTAVPARWRGMAWKVAAALVLLESAALLPLDAPGPRPVDLWLRQQPGSGATAQVPNGFGGHSQFYSLFSGKPTNLGQGKYPPALYREGRNILYGFPKESAVLLMQRWETEYVVVDEAAMGQLRPDWRTEAAEHPSLTLVYQDHGYSVYRLNR